MLTWEDCVEAQALRTKGWSISAIASHLGRDRKTIRAYLNGVRVPGERKPARAELITDFLGYCRQRLVDDPHLWSMTLFEEVAALGFTGSYQAFTASVRKHELRPRCAACEANRNKDRSVIEHPPGEETQWDWLELPDPPQHWGFGGTAHLLLGVLAHSSRWRGWIAECEDQPHLIEGLHQVATRLGGLTARWRFDRMATVCHPGSGRITASFGPVAVHYGVGISICPSRHAWRKGSVEKSADTIAQRWWRTLADDVSVAAAQSSLDRLCTRLDGRKRTRDGVRSTVGELADAEPLRTMPGPFPAVIDAQRTVSNQAQIAFRGNRYSLPPGHCGEVVAVRHKLGSTTLDVTDRHGALLAHHLRQPDGAGAVVRLDEHVSALTKVVFAHFDDREPCRRKTRRPPSAAALAEAERLRRRQAGRGDGEHVVIDFADYVEGSRPLRAGSDEQAGDR
jgi:transposase